MDEKHELNMHDLLKDIHELSEYSSRDNLLEHDIILNNSRLDVYRNRADHYNRFCEIMKSLIGVLISQNGYDRIINCSTWFEFETSESWQQHKMTKANRCMHKYCPHCSRVLSLRRSLEANAYMEQLDNEGYRFIFLTLTVRNEKEADLKEVMNAMNKACADKFLKYVEIKKQFRGFIRKFEMTYNKKRDDFHPHLHLIVAVNKSYFNGKNYITHKRYRELWKRALGADYLPQVNVRVVKKKNLLDDKETVEEKHLEAIDNENFVNGAFEIGKYIAKSSDYLESSEIFETFYYSLFKRRNWTMGGVFKELHQLNKGKRFETELENNEVEYEYITQYTHDRVNNNYHLTRVKKK